MAKIRSNHSTDLGLPDGSVLRPHVVTTVKRWDVLQNHNVIKAWLAAEVIELVDGADDAPPVPVPAVLVPTPEPPVEPVTTTDAPPPGLFTNIDEAKECAKTLGINVHWRWDLERINEEIAAKSDS